MVKNEQNKKCTIYGYKMSLGPRFFKLIELTLLFEIYPRM